MVKKKSKMSAKARMAYVRSFIGKKSGKRGGSLKEQMDYVRSFRGKKKKNVFGGKFPKGTLSEWKSKANSGSAKDRAKYQRAIANWNKLMSKAGFKEKWNANKIKKGGSLDSNVDYRQLIGMYQNRAFGMGYKGGAIRAGAIPVASGGAAYSGIKPNPLGGAITGYGLHPSLLGVKGRKLLGTRGGAIRGAAIRAGYLPGKSMMSKATSKKFDEIYKRHVKQGIAPGGSLFKNRISRIGNDPNLIRHDRLIPDKLKTKGLSSIVPGRGFVTKKDLYRGGARRNSLFMSNNRMKQRQGRRPVTIQPPSDEMVQLYRNLYKDSGIHPENMIDPVVRNDRLQGAGRRRRRRRVRRGGNFLKKGWDFTKRHRLISRAGMFLPGYYGVAARLAGMALGAGLTEEAGLNGRGHPDYIYH